MKKQWTSCFLLVLLLVSGQVLADGMGNGTGWCQSTTGTAYFPFSFDQTIETTDNNQKGKIFEQRWSASGYYTATCDCDNASYRGNNYFSATTGDLTQKGTFSESRSTGYTMYYYVLVPDKLEVGIETLIAGGLNKYVPAPFTSISNKDPTGGGCGGAPMAEMAAGNKGLVRIYILHPLVGQIDIPTITIMNLYLSKSDEAAVPTVPPVASVTMSGTLTVPQSCSINAGQIIEVKLPDVLGKDIRNLGDSPQSAHVTTQVNFTCSNVADGTNLSMSLSGTNDAHNNDYLATDNESIGIRISDKNDNTIVPNGRAELPIDDYQDGYGSTAFTAAPVNTTGKIPHTGEYQATATLEIQIR